MSHQSPTAELVVGPAEPAVVGVVPFGVSLLTDVGAPRPASMASAYEVRTEVQTTLSNPEDGGSVTIPDSDSSIRRD